MNTDPSHDKDRQWHTLVQRARADVPPPVDLAALLNQLPRHAAAAPQANWSAELHGFLGRRVWITGALAACGIVASVWFLNDTIEHELPWIEFVASTSSNPAEETL